MKRLALVIIALGLGWAVWWAYAAYTLRGEITTWFEDRRADGWEASYADLKVRGFPNRLDVTLTDLLLADPDRGVVWEGPFFQILTLSYKPGHNILVWPNTHRLGLPDQQLEITSQGMRASLIHDAEGTVLRSNLEAEVLNFTGPEDALALAGVTAALQQTPVTPADYRLGLGIQAVAGADLGALPDSAQALQVQALMGFDKPWHIDALHRGRPQPDRVELKLAQYQVGDLQLKVAGDVYVDAAGYPDGALDIKAVNWRDMLTMATEAGRLTPGFAATLEDALALLAGLKGNPETLDFTLNAMSGQLFLGPIPLGDAPNLRLP
ncbi:MAG: DUF2125 domain-containing protein [Paracoccaceae bacterium]|nr:DUF2125 domain-containing protein [Paracoccaceae bacterium]